MERWRRNRRSLLLSPLAYLVLRPFVDTARALADEVRTPPCFLLMSKTQAMYPHNRPELWVPQTGASGLVLPDALKPLEPIKQSLNFLCGYEQVAMRTQVSGSDAADWHHSSVTLFSGGLLEYSELRGDDSVAPATNESLDWYVAEKWNTTPLNICPPRSPNDGVSKNGDRISWRRQPGGGVTYVDEVASPRKAWEEVFGSLPPVTSGPNPEELTAEKRRQLTKSILDGTRQDTLALSQVLSGEQRQALEAHETALRELELKLSATPVDPGKNCVRMPEPAETPDSNAEQQNILDRIELTQDVLLATMRCGLRPVMGFHLGHMGSQGMKPGLWENGDQLIPAALRATPEQTEYHNDLWHRAAEDPKGDLWMVRLESRIMEFYARLLVGMSEIPAGETNLLDQSIALYGSVQSWDHSNGNHSFIMAGSGGGRVATGRVLKTNDLSDRRGGSNFAHNDVLISTLHALGFTDVAAFGTASFCKGGVSGFM